MQDRKSVSVEPRVVLVVEDDAALVHAVERNLAVRGYATRTAATVAEAITALGEECPSLLLLDIELPDGSGWEVLRALREGHCVNVPVIVISAMRPNTRLAQELRCVAVLEKPFPIESLMRLIGDQLGDRRSPTSFEAGMEG
jgi:DNA-binding response OmpR family regulator